VKRVHKIGGKKGHKEDLRSRLDRIMKGSDVKRWQCTKRPRGTCHSLFEMEHFAISGGALAGLEAYISEERRADRTVLESAHVAWKVPGSQLECKFCGPSSKVI